MITHNRLTEPVDVKDGGKRRSYMSDIGVIYEAYGYCNYRYHMLKDVQEWQLLWIQMVPLILLHLQRECKKTYQHMHVLCSSEFSPSYR